MKEIIHYNLRNENLPIYIKKFKFDSLRYFVPRCVFLLPVVGAYNTVYAVCSLYFTLPYFTPLHSRKTSHTLERYTTLPFARPRCKLLYIELILL